ncbi:hypothetical protein BUM88_08130 [Acinetobacter calcoaceticus]|uniref:hypothetical protein n=1 Tax=Acinetobacter calcoaceticus TaxID=471 RepID=UPI0009ABBA48|nr:hypothetical protein [Acinetobacter calcoaceticus]AQZ81578.1 hypothetical protein BUM88_08130 [Acinetobacter calcoaceticus]EHU2649461.1 hypothetical protein [Acinetobacter baumannii]
MTKRYFETLTGEVLSVEVSHESPCSHKTAEYLRIDSLGHSSIWMCSKCGHKFNESQLKAVVKT